MYQKDDYLVYKKDVCKVREKRKNPLTGMDSYVLMPIYDNSLVIEVPVDNKMGFIRDVISKEDALEFIKKIPTIPPLSDLDDRYIEKTYRELLLHATMEDLVVIIKTTYLRNKNRVENHKKISDKDQSFFQKAEEYLYNELSIALGLGFDETRDFIIEEASKTVSNS